MHSYVKLCIKLRDRLYVTCPYESFSLFKSTNQNKINQHVVGGALPRIRTIKPEFWTDEDVLKMSNSCALFFIGLWNFCDDDCR